MIESLLRRLEDRLRHHVGILDLRSPSLALVKLEREMLSFGIISRRLEVIVDGQQLEDKDLKKFGRKGLLVNVFIALYMFRVVVVLVGGLYPAHKETIEYALADYFWAIGIAGTVVHFWDIAYSIMCIVFRLVVNGLEARGSLSVATDLATDGAGQAAHLRSILSKVNFMKFQRRSAAAIHLMFTAKRSVIMSSFPLHGFAMYLAFRSLPSWSRLIGHLARFVFYWPWIDNATSAYICAAVLHYCGTLTIKLRLQQVNAIADHLLSGCPVRSRERRYYLKVILSECDIVFDKIAEYNQFSKWFLFCHNYLCSALAAVSLYVPIYGTFDNPFFRSAILATALQILSALIFFSSCAGGVNSNVKALYSPLNSIFVRHFATGQENLWFKIKLYNLICRIASKRKPVSFYCLDLFAYTNYSFLEAECTSVYNMWTKLQDLLNLRPESSALVKLEGEMLTFGIISRRLEVILKGHQLEEQEAKKFNRKCFMVNAFVTVYALRVALVLVARLFPAHEQAVEDVLGEYLWAMGIGGTVVHCWSLVFSLMCLVFRLVLNTLEKGGSLGVVTDLATSRTGRPLRLGHFLSSRNLMSFQRRSATATYLTFQVKKSTIMTSFPLHCLAIYMAFQQRPSWTRLAGHLTRLVLFYPWIDNIASVYICGCLIHYSATLAIKLQLNQIRAMTDQLLSEHSMSPRQRKHHLKAVMSECHLVFDKMAEYNRFSKWFIFCHHYFCSAMAAVSLCVPIYGHFDMPLFRSAILATGFQIIYLLVFFSRCAGGVHANVMRLYSPLNSIYVRHLVAGRGNPRLKIKFANLIGRIASNRKPVSFYCLDLFAYTDYSFFEPTHLTTSGQPTACPPLVSLDISPVPTGFLEMEVIAGFRVWQLAFMGGCAIMVVVIIMCCIFRCRIPRTKQEIEADTIRNQITKIFRDHLEKIPYESLTLEAALPLVGPLEEKRLKRGVKSDKMTFFQKVKKMFSQDDDDDDDESNSQASGSHGSHGSRHDEEDSDSGHTRAKIRPKCSIEITDDDEERAKKNRLVKSTSTPVNGSSPVHSASKKQLSADDAKMGTNSPDFLARQTSTESSDSPAVVMSAPAVMVFSFDFEHNSNNPLKKRSSLEVKAALRPNREGKVPPTPPPRRFFTENKKLSRQSTRLDYDEPTMELEPLPRLAGEGQPLSPGTESDTAENGGPFTV
ncbi:Transmembrane inner ear expressed protein [Halotydeus destructor]|nr:Transmembrane inner ear expressed protein [Halotydeus destructor]